MEAHDIIFLVYFVPSIFLFERVIFLIYAKRKDLNRYLGISSSLDSAIRFLQSADLSQLQMGRNEIDGDQAFINRFDYQTMTPEEAMKVAESGTEHLYATASYGIARYYLSKGEKEKAYAIIKKICEGETTGGFAEHAARVDFANWQD